MVNDLLVYMAIFIVAGAGAGVLFALSKISFIDDLIYKIGNKIL